MGMMLPAHTWHFSSSIGHFSSECRASYLACICKHVGKTCLPPTQGETPLSTQLTRLLTEVRPTCIWHTPQRIISHNQNCLAALEARVPSQHQMIGRHAATTCRLSTTEQGRGPICN